MTLFLKDTKTESIECVFYDCIEFINGCFSNNGKVFVHCVQGVSRSVSICLAWIMMQQSTPFEELIKKVRKVRGVCNPNMGFTVQLLWWHKRLHLDFDAISVRPRTFLVGSFQLEQPTHLVCRLLLDQLFKETEK
jgi:hypothetical protein